MTSSVDLPTAPEKARWAVVFDRVSFAFDDHVVLRDISFRVPKGSMSLLGASGAGKSSLLSSFSGSFDRIQARFSSTLGRSSV